MSRSRAMITMVAVMAWALYAGAAYGQHQHGQEEHEHGQHKHGEEPPGHSHEKASAHDGAVAMTKEFHFETIFNPDEVRVYLYDGVQNPMQVKHWKQGLVQGTVTVQYRDRSRKPVELELKRGVPKVESAEREHGEHEHGEAGHEEHGRADEHKHAETVLWACPMHPEQYGKTKDKCSECGMYFAPQDYLFAKIDLSGIKPDEAKAVFKLTNLPGSKEKEATFAQKVTLTEPESKAHEHGEHEHDEP